MTKQEFITKRVEAERASCLGARARASFNADAAAAKAAAQWDKDNSPEQLARAEKIAALVERGGKLWENRVYFNAIPVGSAGRTFDCYVDLSTGALCGAITEDEISAARAVIGEQS